MRHYQECKSQLALIVKIAIYDSDIKMIHKQVDFYWIT